MADHDTPKETAKMDISEHQRMWDGFMIAAKWGALGTFGLIAWLVGVFALDFNFFIVAVVIAAFVGIIGKLFKLEKHAR
jgi:hypothetical protein